MRPNFTLACLSLALVATAGSALALAGCEVATTPADVPSSDGGVDGSSLPPSSVRGTLDAFATDTALTSTVRQGLSCGDLREKRLHGAVSALAQRLRARRDAFLAAGDAPCKPMDAGAPAAGGGAGAPPASRTNDQVDGVNEPDIVQHDGQHLYALAGNEFVVVRAWPTPGTERLAALDLSADGVPSRFLLVGSKAVVFLRAARPVTGTRCWGPAPAPPAYGNLDSCAGSPACTPADDGTITRVVTIDLADPAHPSIARRTDLPGSLLGARLVGNAVTTIVARSVAANGNLEPSLESVCSNGRARSPEEIVRAFDALFALGRLELEGNLDEPLGVRDHGVREELECASVWAQDGGRGESLVTVSTFDASNVQSPVRSARLLGEPGFVYATPAHVYLGSPEGYALDAGRSFVHRFALGTATRAPAYEASGEVAGRIFGSYGMSEQGETLHVATSSGTAGKTPHMNVYALEATGRTLAGVGALDDVAPGRSLRGVRFLGDRAFVSVESPSGADLLAVDLRDPRAPRLAGTLASPSAAKYLQRLDASTLLTVGTRVTGAPGARLEFVDIADLTAPRLLSAVDILTTDPSPMRVGPITPTDALAFTTYADRKLFALPLDTCDGPYTPTSFGGVALFDTDRTRGFRELARVRGDEDPFPSRCYFGTENHVRRTVFIGNRMYLVTSTAVSVANLDDLTVPATAIPLRY